LAVRATGAVNKNDTWMMVASNESVYLAGLMTTNIGWLDIIVIAELMKREEA